MKKNNEYIYQTMIVRDDIGTTFQGLLNKALKTIKEKDIVELRSMSNGPYNYGMLIIYKQELEDEE